MLFHQLLTSFTDFFSSINTQSVFVLLLSLQLNLSGKNDWPEDYLTRSKPLWTPYLQQEDCLFCKEFWIVAGDNACNRVKYSDATTSKMEFDFIVVGSGPGGSVVANRLSENRNHKILLIEAGRDPKDALTIPSFYLQGKFWNITTGSASFSKALNDGPTFTVGRMLGGSSGMYGMMYNRGHERDFDGWAALGSTGWDFASVLPYFKKSEDNLDPNIINYKNGAYHGTGGYLKVGNFSSEDSFIPVLRSAWSQLGVNEIKDYNSGEHIGFVEVQGMIDNGERISAAKAFLRPIRKRKNLHVMKNSLVNKVLFDGATAVGVNIVTKRSDCRSINVYARKEVIISAGAIFSPKILLQSGIGRAADLAPFSIPQIKDLPVGENHHDHPGIIVFVKLNAEKQSIWDTIVSVFKYLFSRTGQFSYPGTSNYQVFLNTLDASSLYPDIQIESFRLDRGTPENSLRSNLEKRNYKTEFINQIIDFNKDYDLVLFHIACLTPKGRGTVKISSTDPWSLPKITQDLFSNQDDMDTAVRAIAKIRDLMNTSAMQTISAEIVKFDIPECNSLPYPSDAYDRCFVLYFGESGQHNVGTCKMGPASDPTAVVDEKLRVHGVTNLRVVDASIMPVIVSANTGTNTYMIGEKGADMIKQDWSIY